MDGALFRNVDGLDVRVWGGNLFDAQVDAIVSGEQTDFQLAKSEDLVSHQIRKLFGQTVQDQLDLQVARMLEDRNPVESAPTTRSSKPHLDPGTVLRTSGGSFQAIYHAGYFHSHTWLDGASEQNETEHIPIIKRCIHSVLRDLAGSDITSVAIPLLGTGVFGLDPEFVFLLVVETITDYASRHPIPGKTVVIVRSLPPELISLMRSAGMGLDDAGIFENRAIGSDEPIHYGGVQKYRLNPGFMRGSFFELDVPFLDGFATQHVLAANNEIWRVWNALRFGECLCQLMMHYLAKTGGLQPHDLFAAHMQVSFDSVRQTCAKLADLSDASDPWGVYFKQKLQEHAQPDGILAQMNRFRNDIAHGRQEPPFETIFRQLWELMDPPAWQNRVKTVGPIDLDALDQWECRISDTAVGLFERWDAAWTLYIEPISGENFEMRTPR